MTKNQIKFESAQRKNCFKCFNKNQENLFWRTAIFDMARFLCYLCCIKSL